MHVPAPPPTFKVDESMADWRHMTVSRLTRLIPGVLVIVSLLLGSELSPLFLSAYALGLAAFVAIMLAQSAVTGICPLEHMLKRAGLS